MVVGFGWRFLGRLQTVQAKIMVNKIVMSLPFCPIFS